MRPSRSSACTRYSKSTIRKTRQSKLSKHRRRLTRLEPEGKVVALPLAEEETWDARPASGELIIPEGHMAQKRWALSLPLDGFTLAEHEEIAREAERLGYTDAWSLEVDGVDCFSPLAVAALMTHL